MFLKVLFIVSSAMLYALAYIMPVNFWWGVCVFLIPLYYIIIHDKLTIFDGVIWSICAFSLHLFGGLEGLFFYASGTIFFRIIPPVLILVIAVCYGVIWFAVLTCIKNSARTPLTRLLFASIITWLFFLFLERVSFFMLGALEGYLIFNPLVPLIEYPGMLFLLPKIGSSLLLFIFIVTQALVSAAIFWGRYYWFAALFFVSVWLVGIIISPAHPVSIINHNTHNTIVCGREYFNTHDTITYTGRAISDYCKALLNQCPETEIIIFPETAIRCPILPGEQPLVALLNHEHVGKPVTILTGGFRWDYGTYRNTIYWIHNGVLIDLFDKRHAMALTERAPQEYFFKNFIGIQPSTRRRPIWQITQNLKIIPYICSELFFNNNPDHEPVPGAELVALCNDSWLKCDYARYQMVMGARYRAIQWQVPIWYIAYYYQVLCEPSGKITSCQVFQRQAVLSKD